MPDTQQTAAAIKIGSAVRVPDGHANRVIDLVVAPDSADVTHLVVETDTQPGHKVLVPVVLVAAVTNDIVYLDLSTEDLRDLPRYIGATTRAEQSRPRT